MKIIAIDPGYERLGVAILEKNPYEKEKVIFSECFKTSAKDNFNIRLREVGKHMREVIEKYKPEALAIETLYFTTNQKTAIAVAEARGVILYEAALEELSIYEYTPLQIKIAVTGYGRSDKKGVISMVRKLVDIEEKGRVSKDGTRPDFAKSDDEFDAIAIGLCCLASMRN